MKASMRYSLIAVFFLAFFILAPLIVLFVTGTEYDFKSHAFVKTGTLSIQTQPRKAEVYINGELTDATQSTIRFLIPGDYDISVRKTGYFDWNKRLRVNAQYVTEASASSKYLTLFFSNPSVGEIKTGVTNFFAGDRKILYLTKDTLYLGNLSSPTETQAMALPENLVNETTQISILASPDENYFLLYSKSQAVVFDSVRNDMLSISDLLIGKILNPDQFQFSADNKLYYLANSALYQIDWFNSNKKLLLQNVASFIATENTIYFVRFTAAFSNSPAVHPVQSLYQAQLPALNTSTLINQLPNWTASKIYLSSQNQLFIIGDGSLYAVADNLAKIADFVQDVKIFNQLGLLIYSTNNEIGFYDYLNGSGTNSRNQTITRTSSTIKNPVAFPDLGWVFFESDNRLQNIEIDNRDHQNNYTFGSLSDNAKFFMDATAQNIFLLDNGILSKLTIR